MYTTNLQHLALILAAVILAIPSLLIPSLKFLGRLFGPTIRRCQEWPLPEHVVAVTRGPYWEEVVKRSVTDSWVK